MNLFVFTNGYDWQWFISAFLLSVSPIVGGRVASFAYAILARGTYINKTIDLRANSVNRRFQCRTSAGVVCPGSC